VSRDEEGGMNGKVVRFGSRKEIKNTFRKNKYAKEVTSRKKVDVAHIFVIPKQEAIRAD
jgi:uncharacterized protein (DUF1330 family)